MNGDFNIADGHLTDGHLLDVRTNTSLACPDFNVMRSDRLDRTRATMEVSYFKIFTTFRSRITRRPWRDDLCFHWSWPLCPFKSFPLTLRFSNGSVLWKMKMALPSQRWKWPCPFRWISRPALVCRPRISTMWMAAEQAKQMALFMRASSGSVSFGQPLASKVADLLQSVPSPSSIR